MNTQAGGRREAGGLTPAMQRTVIQTCERVRRIGSVFGVLEPLTAGLPAGEAGFVVWHADRDCPDAAGCKLARALPGYQDPNRPGADDRRSQPLTHTADEVIGLLLGRSRGPGWTGSDHFCRRCVWGGEDPVFVEPEPWTYSLVVTDVSSPKTKYYLVPPSKVSRPKPAGLLGRWDVEVVIPLAIPRGETLRRSLTTVELYDGKKADLDTDGGRWQTVCVEHATVTAHSKRSDASDFAGAPDEWCELCADTITVLLAEAEEWERSGSAAG